MTRGPPRVFAVFIPSHPLRGGLIRTDASLCTAPTAVALSPPKIMWWVLQLDAHFPTMAMACDILLHPENVPVLDIQVRIGPVPHGKRRSNGPDHLNSRIYHEFYQMSRLLKVQCFKGAQYESKFCIYGIVNGDKKNKQKKKE